MTNPNFDPRLMTSTARRVIQHLMWLCIVVACVITSLSILQTRVLSLNFRPSRLNSFGQLFICWFHISNSKVGCFKSLYNAYAMLVSTCNVLTVERLSGTKSILVLLCCNWTFFGMLLLFLVFCTYVVAIVKVYMGASFATTSLHRQRCLLR